MFAWHNETSKSHERGPPFALDQTLISHTVNIHSHTIGCLLFAWLPFHFYGNVYSEIENPQPLEALLFVLYFVGVALCFACSAWYVVRMMHLCMVCGKLIRSFSAAMYHGTFHHPPPLSATDSTSAASSCSCGEPASRRFISLSRAIRR